MPCHWCFLVARLWEVETHWFHGRRSTLEVHSKKGCGKPGRQPCRWPAKASFRGASIHALSRYRLLFVAVCFAPIELLASNTEEPNYRLGTIKSARLPLVLL